MTRADPNVVHKPFFLPGSSGRLFALHMQPVDTGPPSRGVLFFPPFAEEMNKSRRMVSLQARRVAAMGYQVLLVDLYGTGDSEGDFGDARWDIWRADMLEAARWLQKNGASRLTLWGLRLGALLAMQIEADIRSNVDNILFWQPVVNGEAFFTQFLRLRIAGEMVSGGDKLTTRDLRCAFKKGETIEVAGYSIHPDLAAAIDPLTIDERISVAPAPVCCFQISPSGKPTAIGKRLGELRDSNGYATRVVALAGEQFWKSAEIAVVDEFLDLCTDWFDKLL